MDENRSEMYFNLLGIQLSLEKLIIQLSCSHLDICNHFTMVVQKVINKDFEEFHNQFP